MTNYIIVRILGIKYDDDYLNSLRFILENETNL